MTEIPIHTRVSPSMHPNLIRGESPGAALARNALGKLYIAEGQIRDLHAVVHNKAVVHQQQAMAQALAREKQLKKGLVKDKDKTEVTRPPAPPLIYDQGASAHIIEVGRPLAQAALKAVDAAIETMTEQVKHLDTAIDQKITAGKNPARGQELRAWAARQESPFQTLGGLFQKANQNATLVAEICGSECYLSNLSAENQNHLRVMAASVMAPDEVQARAETSAALGQITGAAKSFVSATVEIFTALQSPEATAINAIVKEGADQ